MFSLMNCMVNNHRPSTSGWHTGHSLRKNKLPWKTKENYLSFDMPKNMVNFETFCKVNSSSIKLFLLKSEPLYLMWKLGHLVTAAGGRKIDRNIQEVEILWLLIKTSFYVVSLLFRNIEKRFKNLPYFIVSENPCT